MCEIRKVFECDKKVFSRLHARFYLSRSHDDCEDGLLKIERDGKPSSQLKISF